MKGLANSSKQERHERVVMDLKRKNNTLTKVVELLE